METSLEKQEKRNLKKSYERQDFGLFLVFFGIMAILVKMDIVDIRFHWWVIGSGMMLIFGLISLIRATNANEVSNAIFQIGISIWIYACFERLGGLTFSNSWPYMLILYGLSQIVSAYSKSSK